MKRIPILLPVIFLLLFSCKHKGVRNNRVADEALPAENTFGYDSTFLVKYIRPVFLFSTDHAASLIISPEYQGRVMTSTAAGQAGRSFGWVNYDLIASGKTIEKINPVGGEDRIWLGPEGGQYSLFFAPGTDFVYKNWQTPLVLDTEPFNLIESNDTSVLFRKSFEITNYSGTIFKARIDRRINLLSSEAIEREFGVHSSDSINIVSYESINRLTNTGSDGWDKDHGLISIWILGMYVPSPSVVIFAPYKNGPDDQDKQALSTSYFGSIPPDNLKITDHFVFFKGDGKYRSKIGIPPSREGDYIAAWDPDNHILTVVRHNKPEAGAVYVNSLWKYQEHPYNGDAVNAYNDGPLENGGQLGPFYEVETSSPGAEIGSMESLVHVQQTIHFTGDDAVLERIAQKNLGISLSEVKNALK